MSAYVGERLGERRGRRMSLPRSERPPGKIALRGLELALFAVVIAALGVFHVWSRTRVVEAGYQLGQLQQEHTRLVAAQDGLKLEIGMLTSAQALDRAARGKLARLGLAPPDRGAVWAAGPDRASGDPGRAGGKGVDHPPRPAGPILGMADGGAAILASAGPGGGAWPGASGRSGGAQSEANAPPGD